MLRCSLLIVTLAFTSASAQAMPLPPSMRGADPSEATGPTKVKVRRIEQVKPISTTAPAPRGALAGKHRVLVVLVETADARFAPERDKAHFEKFFFAEEGLSLRSYYREMSYGLYDLQGEVLGPIRLPQSIASFGYNPAAGNGAVAPLIEKAFIAASEHVKLGDFDGFDKFGRPGPDGTVDHLAVVVPRTQEGHDAIFSPIWPHRGTITLQHGAHKLNSYFVMSDAAPLGAAVHEFGHDIGLPDLYDRDDSSHGVGEWCTMGSGSWLREGQVPGHLSAWAKIRLGWIRPTVMSRSRARVSIPAVEREPFAVKVPVGSIDSAEYFLVENRQRVGFDAHLPDHGLLIWHINEKAGHNDDEMFKLVDVEEPVATQDLDVMYRGTRPDHLDTFRAGRKDVFGHDSDPSSLTAKGKPSGVTIKHVSVSEMVMHADFEVPTLRDPGGEPYRLMHDNYNYGPFSNVRLGSGAEKLVRFTATEGAYEVRGFEALLMSKPRTRADLSLRVYASKGDKPGKVLWERRTQLAFGDDAYAWLKARIDLPEGLRVDGGKTFWVGVEHHDDVTGLAHNPDSTSGRSLLRMDRNQALRDTFGPGRPVPDFILRVDGYGFIGVTPSSPEPADENDPLVTRMRTHDAQLDGDRFQDAAAGYRDVLVEMQKQPARYVSWVPVVQNSLGVAAYQAKDYPTALEYFARSLRHAQQAEDPRAVADILQNLGETSFHHGELDNAASYCGRSEAMNGDRPGRLMENKYWLGRIAYAQGRKPQALAYLAQVMPLVEQVFAADDPLRATWKSRVERAKAGKAKGEDWQGESRMLQEMQEERALEDGQKREEDTHLWKLDLADFGLEGEFAVEE